MDSDDLLHSQNVDDIIAQYDNDDTCELSAEINVDDLLKDDLVTATLASPNNDADDSDEAASTVSSSSRPKLTSSLPAPAAPAAPKTSNISRYAKLSIDEDAELDIETIINDSKIEDDDLLNDDMNDALLDFDPEDMSSTLNTSADMNADPNKSTNPTKYSDMDLETISSLIKREEIRMKQQMEIGNYKMIEPLTKRMENTQNRSDDSSEDLERSESFFKLELRENITKTLDNFKSEYGAPTVVKSHTKFIAMGMKNGSVFIFDHFEQLRLELTCNDARALRMGSVTCLDFNHNGTLLMVGYNGGQLVLWDILNNKELKKIKDAHVSPIVFVMFYRRGALRVASCDSNGIMFTWSFTKIFFSYNYDRSTLFNGKRAGVLYDVALYKSNPNAAHILDSLSLCAVANNESVFFVTLEPPFTLKQTVLLPNTGINELKRGALPMLAWRLSYNKSRNNPCLAVGSGTVIQFIEIFVRDETRFYQTRDTSLIRMRGIGQIQLKKLVVAMRWLNEENLIILTANDEILICNGSPMMRVTETIWPIPIKEYAAATSSPLNEFLLSSNKMDRSTDKKISMDFFIRHQYFGKHIICFKHCFETIAGLDKTGQTNKLIITTNSNIVSAHCMTWFDRTEKLIKEGEWIKACCLIISFWNKYENGEIQQSQNIDKLLSKMDAYILQFCEFVVQSNKISDDELESFGGVAMDYCVCLKRTDSLLFDKVYNILLNHGGREIFFKLLEPYILNDRITRLPPDFMRKFADFLVSRDKIYQLQQIILHLIPESFDIHQIVSICRENELFIALCYLYNRACFDYADPIRDMFYKIIKKKGQDYNAIIARGYQLILYLKYIMNGTTFPWCNVLETPLKAKQQIFNVLFDESEQYQILRHLLALDLKQVLFHIIKIGFDDTHLFRAHSIANSPNINRSSNNSNSSVEIEKKSRRTSIQMKSMLSNAQSAVMNGAKWAWSLSAISAISQTQSPNTSRRNTINTSSNDDGLDANISLKTKQEMFNVLVDIIIYEMGSESADTNDNENEIFYEFCTPLLASGECEVNIHLLKSVLNYLFSESLKLLNKIKITKQKCRSSESEDKKKQMQRELDRLQITYNNFENTILILLSRKMEQNSDDFDIKDLLRMANASKFHKVELYLHRECGNHWAVIDSYLADTDLETQVFDYIHNLFYDITEQHDIEAEETKDKFINVIKIVLKRLHKLVVINSESCAQLVFKWFAIQYFDETVAALSNDRHTQYIFLRQVVECMRSLNHKKHDVDKNDDKLAVNNLEQILLENEFEFKQKQHELFIRLLCEFEAESVLSYLSSHSDEFDIDLVARYCDKFEILDGSSYLRERSGDILGALQLVLKSIAQQIHNLWDIFGRDYFVTKKITSKSVQNNSYYISTREIQRILNELMMAIGLCQRNAANKSLWNHLLDSCLVSQQKITNDIKTPSFRQKYPSSEIRYLMKQTVNDIVSKTLTAMMTEKNIDLCDMFEKLVDKESSEKYEYYRDTIDVMLSTYKYETEMLQTANNLFRFGVHKEYKHYCNVSAHAFENTSNTSNENVCNLCNIKSSNKRQYRLRLFYCGHLFHQHCLSANVEDDKCPICNKSNKSNQSNQTAAVKVICNKRMKSVKSMKIFNKNNYEIQNQVMVNYAKKLNQFKQKLQYRDQNTNLTHVPLCLAPRNKDSLPKAAANMHVPVANWQLHFEHNRKQARVIEID